jgi:hypothetical protein
MEHGSAKSELKLGAHDSGRHGSNEHRQRLGYSKHTVQHSD